MFKLIRANCLKIYIKHLPFIPPLSSPTLRTLFRKRVEDSSLLKALSMSRAITKGKLCSDPMFDLQKC